MLKEAFIGLTDDDWFDFHATKEHHEVVFFTTRKFFLEEGTPFLFLCGVGTPNRNICGSARVKSCKTSTVKETWDEHKERTGSESLGELISAISSVTSKKLIDEGDPIHYWELREFKPFQSPIYSLETKGEGSAQKEIYGGEIEFPKSQQIGIKVPLQGALELIREGNPNH